MTSLSTGISIEHFIWSPCKLHVILQQNALQIVTGHGF